MRHQAISTLLIAVALIAICISPASAYWQFVWKGPGGERQASPHFTSEKECKSALKVTESTLAKKFPERYPLVGSCEEYR
jgi:hypothetical protein